MRVFDRFLQPVYKLRRNLRGEQTSESQLIGRERSPNLPYQAFGIRAHWKKNSGQVPLTAIPNLLTTKTMWKLMEYGSSKGGVLLITEWECV